MLDSADALFSKMWSYPLKFLCGLTGKSNYFFAKLALTLSFIFLWTKTLLEITESSLGDNVIGISLGIFITLFMYLPICVNIAIDERINSENKSDSIHYSQLHNLIGLRIFFTFAPLVFLPSSVLMYDFVDIINHLWALLLAASIYFALDNRPGKKSWVKIGIDKLVEAVKKIHIPNPIPSPIPVPTS